MGGFSIKSVNEVRYYTIDKFEQSGRVKTCISCRNGGVSKEQFSTLNLGYKTGDDKANIDKNFGILCSATGIRKQDMVLADQVHGDRCMIVGEKDRGKGIIVESDIKGIDSLVTNIRNVALCIFTADCVPVFLFDTRNSAIGLLHAGWRGVVGGIVTKTLAAMSSHYGSSQGDIIAAIAPSIGPCCFEVGSDVAEQFTNIFGNTEGIVLNENGKLKIDLWTALKRQLQDSGMVRQIINSGLCTYCTEDNFFSYRRDGSKTGRIVSIIQLI